MSAAVADAVTALFVPGDRPDRYAKAASSGADVVIIDLEDAVAPGEKSGARDIAISALRPRPDAPAGSTLRALVRINDPESTLGAADLVALVSLASEPGHGLIGVVVPKAGHPAALATVIDTVSALAAGPGSDGIAVVALIESALGVANVRALAALPGLNRLAFGALDFGLDVGADVDSLTGQVARAEVVIASRAAGLHAPWESPSTSLTDTALIESTSRAARALGFGGRLCIHPAQLAAVRAGFTPSAEEVAWARRIAGAGDAVSRVDDQMVDRPVLERARSILRRAR